MLLSLVMSRDLACTLNHLSLLLKSAVAHKRESWQKVFHDKTGKFFNCKQTPMAGSAEVS